MQPEVSNKLTKSLNFLAELDERAKRAGGRSPIAK